MSVASWFLVDGETSRAPAREPAVPAIVTGRMAALLESPRGERGLGAMLGLALARDARVPAALVLGWRTRGPGGCALPSTPAVRRLTRALRARDLAARSTGRIVHVELPQDEADAAVAASRAVAASPAELPVVIALGGARGPALDALLAGVDLVVVASASDDPRARAALDGVAGAGTGVRAVTWDAVPGTVWRRVARAGVAVGGGCGLPAEVWR